MGLSNETEAHQSDHVPTAMDKPNTRNQSPTDTSPPEIGPREELNEPFDIKTEQREASASDSDRRHTFLQTETKESTGPLFDDGIVEGDDFTEGLVQPSPGDNSIGEIGHENDEKASGIPQEAGNEDSLYSNDDYEPEIISHPVNAAGAPIETKEIEASKETQPQNGSSDIETEQFPQDNRAQPEERPAEIKEDHATKGGIFSVADPSNESAESSKKSSRDVQLDQLNSSESIDRHEEREVREQAESGAPFSSATPDEKTAKESIWPQPGESPPAFEDEPASYINVDNDPQSAHILPETQDNDCVRELSQPLPREEPFLVLENKVAASTDSAEDRNKVPFNDETTSGDWAKEMSQKPTSDETQQILQEHAFSQDVSGISTHPKPPEPQLTATTPPAAVENELEDAWAKAMGGGDAGLDDAWGAAFEDDEGFLEEEPPALPAGQMRTRNAKTANQYAPMSSAQVTTNNAPTSFEQPRETQTPGGGMKFFEDLPVSQPQKRKVRPTIPSAQPLHPPQSQTASTAPTPTQTQRSTSTPSTEGGMKFFEDFPVSQPSRRKPKQQYSPALASNQGMHTPGPPPGSQTQSSDNQGMPQLRQPERLDPFPPQPTVQPQQPSSLTRPPQAPSANQRYSPAPLAASRTNYSPAPAPQPGGTATPASQARPPSHVSPASHAHPASHAPPPNKRYSPAPPHLPSQRPSSPRSSGSAAQRSSPAPLAPEAQQRYSPAPAIPASDKPHPPLPSEVAQREQPSVQIPAASRSSGPTSASYSSIHRRRMPSLSETLTFAPPSDPTQATDPLQRWKGCPTIMWNATGTLSYHLPRRVPRYGGGQAAPTLKCSAGEVKLLKNKDLLPVDEALSSFPGPLNPSKPKGKKKEVSLWLSSRIESLQRDASTNQISMDVRIGERVMLWKLLHIMVEHDGNLSGNPSVDMAVRQLLSIGASRSQAKEQDQDAQALHSDAVSPGIINSIHSNLVAGERDKAIWIAADNRLWGYALLMASKASPSMWKQVIQEFVRKEVRSAGPEYQSLAALCQVFAGNSEESIDELVPVSARAGFQMMSTTDPSESKRKALEGLDKWQETLMLILCNRSSEDEKGLVALGRLLRDYGRIEAAHICFPLCTILRQIWWHRRPRSRFYVTCDRSIRCACQRHA